MIWQKVNQIVMMNKGFCVYQHQQESHNHGLTGLEEQWLAGVCLVVLCCLLPLPNTGPEGNGSKGSFGEEERASIAS